MAIDTGLEGRPWYFGAVLGVVVAAVLGYAGYTLQIEAMLKTRVQQKRRLTDLESQIIRGRAAERRMPELRAQVAVLEDELEKLLLILPPRRDVPTVLRRFRALAEQGDFSLDKFVPASEVERDFYNEWPIAVELHGTYHNLAGLFDRMSRFSRIFNVDTMTIQQRPSGSHSVVANFVAKTFVYKEPATDELGLDDDFDGAGGG